MSQTLPAQIEQKPVKTLKVSRRVRHAIDLMVNGEARTQKAAAEKAGLTREAFCRALKQSHVQAHLANQTRVLLAQSQAPAAATLVTLLDQAKSEHVRKDVAVTLLGINGYRPAGDNRPVVNVNFGYSIDLRSSADAPGRIMNGSEIGGVIIDAEDTASAPLLDVSKGYGK